ncbi:30S ribosomal protein S16 [Streptomyces chlorus]|uniref:Small ribosomal subunit protein bS16 n=1 Tax=Streptomyces chlorus TaxID=887452 RepID=A0ABW1DV81_9ACTN
MAVKIKLKRLGKIRSPHYRIVVADSRTRRDGRAIEEIGKYHPTYHPSVIEVDGERVAYWLGVGAQPTEPVLAILKKTGDWQKYKGEPAPAPLLQQAEKAGRPLFEALGGEDEGKGEAITQKKKTEKKDEAPAESASTEA